MDILAVPTVLRERLEEAGADGLVTMFADAHRLAVESFDRRLAEETGKIRLDMANLKFDLLKWTFLFWISQLAAMVALLR